MLDPAAKAQEYIERGVSVPDHLVTQLHGDAEQNEESDKAYQEWIEKRNAK